MDIDKDIFETSQEILLRYNSVKPDLSVYETRFQYLEMANNNLTRHTCKIQYLEMANNNLTRRTCKIQYLEMANNNLTRRRCKLQYLEMANNKKHMQMNISQQKYARGS